MADSPSVAGLPGTPITELGWHERMSALDAAIDSDDDRMGAHREVAGPTYDQCHRTLLPGFALLAAGNAAVLGLLVLAVYLLAV